MAVVKETGYLEDYIDQPLVRASQGQRFANYLIDLVVFYVVLIGIGIFMLVVSPNSIDAISGEDVGSNFLDRIVSLVIYAVLMSLIEGFTKGKSIGKLISGTRAVNLDGTPISFATAFARGFSRAVPLCVFSAFGTPCNPWQDSWTKTMVIDEKASGVK